MFIMRATIKRPPNLVSAGFTMLSVVRSDIIKRWVGHTERYVKTLKQSLASSLNLHMSSFPVFPQSPTSSKNPFASRHMWKAKGTQDCGMPLR